MDNLPVDVIRAQFDLLDILSLLELRKTNKFYKGIVDDIITTRYMKIFNTTYNVAQSEPIALKIAKLNSLTPYDFRVIDGVRRTKTINNLIYDLCNANSDNYFTGIRNYGTYPLDINLIKIFLSKIFLFVHNEQDKDMIYAILYKCVENPDRVEFNDLRKHILSRMTDKSKIHSELSHFPTILLKDNVFLKYYIPDVSYIKYNKTALIEILENIKSNNQYIESQDGIQKSIDDFMNFNNFEFLNMHL